MKCFFINAQIPEVNFLLRREAPTTLAAAQALTIEIEDDLILAGKIRIVASGFEENNYSSNSFSSSTRTDPAVQRLANEILALKKKIAQGMFFVPHEDVPRRPLPTIPHSSIVGNRQKLHSPFLIVLLLGINKS